MDEHAENIPVRRTWRQRLGAGTRLIARGLLTGLVLLGLLWGALQTSAGKQALAIIISMRLSPSSDRQVVFEDISGVVPFRFRIGRLALYDLEGPWLEFNGIQARWNPWTIWWKRINFYQVNAESAHFNKRPPSRPLKPYGGLKRLTPRRLAGMFLRWPRLCADQITVKRFVFDEAVTGEAAVFSARGVMPEGFRGSLDLEAWRIEDGPESRAKAIIRAEGHPSQLNIDITLNEAPGGYLAHAFKVKEEGALDVRLAGAGPVDDWHGTLAGDAWGLGQVHAGMLFADRGAYWVDVNGAIRLDEALASERMAPLIAGETRVALTTHRELPGQWRVDALNVRGGIGQVQAAGRLDLEQGVMHLLTAWRVNDLRCFERAAGQPMEGAGCLAGVITGAFSRPEMHMAVHGGDVRTGKFRASRVNSEWHIIETETGGHQVVGTGSVSGVAIEGTEDWPEPAFTWSGQLASAAHDQWTIPALTVEGKDTRLQLSGEGKPSGPSGSFEATAEIRALQDWAATLGLDMNGAATITAKGEGDWDARAVTASVDGSLRDAEGLPEILAAILGPQTAFQGNVAVENGERITVADAKAAGTALLTGAGQYGIEERHFDARWTADVADARKLGEALKQRLAGRVKVTGETSGKAANFETKLDLQGEKVEYQAFHSEKLTGHAELAGLPDKPAGPVRITLAQGPETFKAEAQLTYAKPMLAFNDFKGKGADAEVNGALRMDTQTRLITGAIEGNAEDLERIGAFAKEALQGKAKIAMRLKPVKGRQQAVIEAHVDGIASRWGQATEIAVDASFDDLWGKPNGKASFTGREVVAKQTAFSQITGALSGTLDEVTIDAQAEGTPYTPFEIRAGGKAALGKKQQELTVTRLKGEYQEVPFTLEGPANFKRNADGYSLDSTRIKIDRGRVEAAGSWNAKSVNLTASWRNLPLALAKALGGTDIKGTAEGKLQVTGTLESPQAETDLKLEDVAFPGTSFDDAPPFTAILQGSLRNGRCDAAVQIEGIVEKPMRGTLEAPLTVTLSPWKIAAPRDGALKGQFAADTNLDRLAQVFLVDEHHLAGDLQVAFDLAGSVESPQVTGRAELAKGAYENERTGVVVRGAEIELIAKGPRIEVLRASANDGASGTYTAKGRMSLDPDERFAYTVDIEAKNARLVQRDDLTAAANGQATLKGDSNATKLSGALAVTQAEIRISERRASAVPVVDVVDVNAPEPPPALVMEEGPPASETARKAKPAAGSWKQAFGYDLNVDVPGVLTVTAPDSQSQWRGKLQVAGTAAAPQVSGNFSAVRGYLFFLNQRFVLRPSHVDFDTQHPPSPSVDINLETRARDLTAQLRLAGPLSRPEITLTSDPALPQDEVLAQLVFGRNLREISPMRALQLAQAARRLSGGGGVFDFLAQTRRSLGISDIEVVQTGEEGKETTAVNVGAYLTDKVYVEMQKDINQAGGRVSVEAEVAPNVTVESEVGSDAKGGIWLQWERDY